MIPPVCFLIVYTPYLFCLVYCAYPYPLKKVAEGVGVRTGMKNQKFFNTKSYLGMPPEWIVPIPKNMKTALIILVITVVHYKNNLPPLWGF